MCCNDGCSDVVPIKDNPGVGGKGVDAMQPRASGNPQAHRTLKPRCKPTLRSMRNARVLAGVHYGYVYPLQCRRRSLTSKVSRTTLVEDDGRTVGRRI